jgi:hypothetical protein
MDMQAQHQQPAYAPPQQQQQQQNGHSYDQQQQPSYASVDGQRTSRWEPESVRIQPPGLPLLLTGQLNDEQLKQYVRILRIEDLVCRCDQKIFIDTTLLICMHTHE